MKKITQLLFLFVLASTVSYSQTIEAFEDETVTSTAFTHIEQTFNITSTSGENYDVYSYVGGGWNGTTADNQFIDNSGSGNNNGSNNGSSFTIKHNNTNINFTVKDLYIFCSTNNINNTTGTLTIEGKKDGALVTGYTITKNSGFSNVQTFSPNNGFTYINFATEGGVDNSNKIIDELVISGSNDLDYMALDAFKFDLISKVWDGSTNTDWSTAANWSEDVLPSASDDVVIPNVANKPIISSTTGAVANNITIDASSSLTVESGGTLIIEGSATVNGDFSYKVNVPDDKWHLVSSPVTSEKYDDAWNTANSIATSIPNEAVAIYTNATDADGDWQYYQDGSGAETFNIAKGYSLKRTGAGNYTFTGTFPAPPINAIITAQNVGNSNENRWNLVGNPNPAYINIATFLATNALSLTDSHVSVYVWNPNAGTEGEYQDLQTGFIHPGQAFFISSKYSFSSVSFTKAMQSDQNGITFYKTTSNPKLTLLMADDTTTKSTEINYLAGKTTSLDPGFDIGTFTGQPSGLNIYTHLVNNSEGVNFKKQALPDTNFENMVISVGVSATADKEITFSAEGLNLPSGIKIFLEDRITNTFTRLDEANSTYKVTPTANLSGIGRFYLHTTTNSALSVDKNVALNNVSIYKLDKSTLRIAGLSQEKTTISIFNLVGKQVVNTSFTSNGVKDIDLPNLSKGVYLVQLATENGKLNKKIILE